MAKRQLDPVLNTLVRERLESDIGPRLVNLVRNVEVALSGR